MTLSVAPVAGDPRRMGQTYGDILSGEIAEAVSFYESLAERAGTDLEAVGKLATSYLDAAREAMPALVEEVEGLAEGARIPVAVAGALNCFEEVWPSESCTTLVSGRFLMHAEQWYAGHSRIGVIMARPNDGPAFVSPTCAGFLPAVGMSAAGFAQGIDSLTAPDDRVGVPRVLVSRLAMGAGSLEDAILSACTEHRAGGYAHCLATTERSVVVETSATAHFVLEGQAVHTNHYLAPAAGQMAEPTSSGSAARLARADQLLGESPPGSLEDCAAILSDHHGEPQTICLHESGLDAGGTVFGMVCDLSTGVVAVSDGPPCAGRWADFQVPGFVRERASRVG
jgi:isopenicillin-N N-acyltransferase-like protein